jgi:cytochrome c biogenesis protein CcdA
LYDGVVGLGVLVFSTIYRHFQQYFSYIVAVSFIVGGNWNTTDLPQLTDKYTHNIFIG